MPSEGTTPRNLIWKTVLPVAAILALVVGGLLVIRSQGSSGHQDGKAGGPADIRAGATLPDFSLKKFGGGEIKASELKSKVTLINFWATWCEPCITELPSLVKLRQKFKDQGFEVVAVDVDDSPEQVLPRAIKRYGLDWGVYLDPEQKLAELFDISGIPLTVIIDRNRKILFVERGGRNWNDEDTQSKVKGWLAG